MADVNKAKDWLRIVAVLEHNGYLSMSLVVSFVDNIYKNFGIGDMTMYEQERKNVDLEGSEAFIYVELKDD